MIGAGKDTMVKHLVENHGFIKGSFSKPLKDAVASIFDWDRELLEGATPESREWRERIDPWWDQELDGVTDQQVSPRWVLQHIGTEVMRESFHKDIWVLAAKNWLRHNTDKRIVFSDTRFINELQMLHELDGVTLGIYRQLPKWLATFYEDMDSRACCGDSTYKPFFKYLDTSNRQGREQLVRWAEHAYAYARYSCPKNKAMSDEKFHVSDLQHLVWPHYKGVIDNRGSIKASIDQLETILKQQGIL
jgi:hypothetical protein